MGSGIYPRQRSFEDCYMPEPNTGCWLWLRSRDRKGYGFYSGITGNGSRSAHRASWEIANGPIPLGFFVLHKCDTPQCVNPDHLELGTHKKNMDDAKLRGLFAVGEAHPSAKLTDVDVMEIRRRLAADETQVSIAPLFNVSQSHISAIHLNKKWKHLYGRL
jgi:hypothetical protein